MNSYQRGQMFSGKYLLSSPENYFNMCPEYLYCVITGVLRQYRADSDTVRIFIKSTILCEKGQPRTVIPGYPLLLGQSKNLNFCLQDR